MYHTKTRVTLRDQITGRVKFDNSVGLLGILTIRKRRNWYPKIGYAKTKKEILGIVEEILMSKAKPTHMPNGWWESFRSRDTSIDLTNSGEAFICMLSGIS